MQYVLFLRGINVGGKQVKMELLKKVFEEKGFSNVKTILASGNIIFETESKDIKKLKAEIERILLNTFHFSIHCILLTSEKLKEVYAKNPFKTISKKSETKFYVSFFQEKPLTKIRLPFNTENFSILLVLDNCVYSIVTLTKNFGTVDAMEILEKEFGKDITTRNWNTIEKICSTVT